MDLRSVLDRLAAAEDDFLRSEFLAPLPGGGTVHVRIAGIVCRLRSARFRGWGVFRPCSLTEAVRVRLATLTERQAYLRLFPRVRLVLVRRAGRDWLAVPAHPGDGRDVPVLLTEDVQAFEVIEGRADGRHVWFDRLDPGHDPARAAYLRDALHALTPPDALDRPGLTPGERVAYARAYADRLATDAAARRSHDEVRLRTALEHAGAELRDFIERGDGYRVEFTVEGRRHVAAVARGDLAVQVAGVCLAGADRHFDLQSLAGVLREADGALRVGHDNDGIDEAQYWEIHPPVAE